MSYPGIAFMMNDQGVTAPDDIDWTTITMGDDLDGLEHRSHYRTCKWLKTVDPGCAMDWFDFDNTILTAFVCPPPDDSKSYEVYTDAICKSVKAVHHHGVMQQLTAIILVRVV